MLALAVDMESAAAGSLAVKVLRLMTLAFNGCSLVSSGLVEMRDTSEHGFRLECACTQVQDQDL